MKKSFKFKFLEHKSDVLFIAFGRNLKELIENAAEAMFYTISKISKIKPDLKIRIRVKAESLESLVIEALNTALAKSDAKEVFFNKMRIEKLDLKKNKLTAVLSGCSQKPELGKTVVKAATFHEFEIKKRRKLWSVKILLDI